MKGQGVLVGKAFQNGLHMTDYLPSQMTGFNAYFSLLKVDIAYQKVIVYANHFGLNRKTVFLICSLCMCVIGIPLYMQHTPALYGVW